MKLFLKTLIAFTFAFSCLFAFSACGDKDATQEEAPAAEEPAMATIGEKVEGEHVFTVNLTNSTGYDIVGFAIKLCEEAEFTTDMLAEGDVYTSGETRILYFDASYGYDYMASVQSASDVVSEPAFDVRLTLKATEEGAENTVVVLHQFPFGDMTQGELLLAEGIAYVSYPSASSGETVSTLEAEKLILQNSQAAASSSQSAATDSNKKSSSNNSGSNSKSNSNTHKDTPVETPDSGSDDGGCIGDEGLVY